MSLFQRKAASDWYSALRLQMDVDILKNSEDYLINRVVDCRIRLTSGHVIDDTGGLDRVVASPVDGRQNVRTKTAAVGPQSSGYDNNVFGSGYNAARVPPGVGHQGTLSGRVADTPPSGYDGARDASGNHANRGQIRNKDVSAPSSAPPTGNPVTDSTTRYTPTSRKILLCKCRVSLSLST